ncbi:hypothetical protein L7F22_015096 [Adiantum nelumboides]|nr:hypothetical protein [Adiantum nelumboides]
MSHFNARIPKRPRGSQALPRVNEGEVGNQESVPTREESGLGSHESIFETQLNEDMGFMELFQEGGWGGTLNEPQMIKNIGLSQGTVPLPPSATPSVRPMPPPATFIPMISQGFRPPRMGASPTVHAVNVRPTLSSTSPAPIALRPPVTSSSESTKGPKRPRVTTPVWDEAATSTLLKHYEERWSHVNKGNLRPKDWEEVTLQLNNDVTRTFTPEQVRNRIDTLRKKYKKEKSKTTTTGGVRSTWEYFEAGSQGHQEGEGINDGEQEGEGEVGVEGGGDGGGETETIVEETVSVGGTADGEDTTRVPQVQDLPGVKAQKVKEPKRTSLGSIAKVLGEGMKGMSQTMKDCERQRADQEERMLKLRMDEERRRMEMYIKFQLDLAKIVTKSKDG